jgi:signal transduction histidine kinase
MKKAVFAGTHRVRSPEQTLEITARSRPEETADALRVVEDTSKGALTEMRRLLGVLRTDDTQNDEHPRLACDG